MNYFETAKNVLEIEAQSLLRAKEKLDENSLNKILSVFSFLSKNNGNLIICGVGKSGLVAQKIASTFCSLGLPSYFLHPVEALHGDLGRVRENDAIIFISKSGTTEEILNFQKYLPILKENIIGLLGNINSPIGEIANINFDCSVTKEACLNNQAPTTSSTLAMAMGDTLAVVFEQWIGLSKENFAANHPAGFLGKSLRIKVSDLMTPLNKCPQVTDNKILKEVIIEMTKNPIGACVILGNNDSFEGIIVDGDIRRTFTKDEFGIETNVKEIMNSNPVSIAPNDLAIQALELMEKREKQIDILPVLEGKKFLGFIRLHDLIREGLLLADDK